MSAETSEEKNHTDYKTLLNWFLIGLLVLLVIYSGFSYVLVKIFDFDWRISGLFGDTFGALTSFFTALAFLAIIISLHFQRKDLSVQIEHLEETIKEAKVSNEFIKQQVTAMKEQTRAIMAQNSVMGEQRGLMKEQSFLARQEIYIDTFFRLLSQKNEIVSTIGVHNIRILLSNINTYAKLSPIEYFIRETKRDENVLPYCRSVAEVFVYVRDAISDKKFYSNIAVVGLSQPELEVLLLYGLTSYGSSFKSLAESLSIFRNLYYEGDEMIKSIVGKYDRMAFEEPDEALSPHES